MFAFLRQGQERTAPVACSFRKLGNLPFACGILRIADRTGNPSRAEHDAKVSIIDRLLPFRRPQNPVADPAFLNSFYRKVVSFSHLRVRISDKGAILFVEVDLIRGLVAHPVIYQVR